MQNFILTQAFRGWEEGTQFTRDADGEWRLIISDEEDEEVSDEVMETLLDANEYLEEVIPVTPEPVEEVGPVPTSHFNTGDTFFYISGAGEVKSKSWTDSVWCRNCANFLGAYRTQAEAEDRANVYGRLIRTFNSMN